MASTIVRGTSVARILKDSLDVPMFVWPTAGVAGVLLALIGAGAPLAFAAEFPWIKAASAPATSTWLVVMGSVAAAMGLLLSLPLLRPRRVEPVAPAAGAQPSAVEGCSSVQLEVGPIRGRSIVIAGSDAESGETRAGAASVKASAIEGESISIVGSRKTGRR